MTALREKNGLRERTVEVNGKPCRVWEKGAGEPLGFLAGLGGLQHWPPLLEMLSEHRRVIVPSLPGYPGGIGHNLLDTQLDWVLAAQELLEAAGLKGADLVGVSVGGSLAAEVAAIWDDMVKRLVLVAPLGLYDDAQPVLDVFALAPRTLPQTLCADPEQFTRYSQPAEAPEGTDEVDWQIEQVRAGEAAARMLWPLSNTRLEKRLPRIRNDTLILWGEKDQVISPAYAQRFAAAMTGETEVRIIKDAGHLADLDAPEELGEAVLSFCS